MLGQSELFMLVYVDDLLWIRRDKLGIEKIILIIYFMTVLGWPFAWKKIKGGVDLAWVGFEISLKGSKLGLSVARSQWLVKWLSETADTDRARVADMSASVGAGHLRPFLGPVYAWTAAMSGEGGSCQRRSSSSSSFLAKALAGSGRLVSMPPAPQKRVELFRTDARAEGMRSGLEAGLWDSSDTKQCRWFSEKLCHANAPWLFTGGEGYRQIASLELLATLAAVLVFVVPVNMRSKMHCSAGTDNKGNSHVVARLLTTKFPLAGLPERTCNAATVRRRRSGTILATATSEPRS